jgi:hypothetical protein
VAKRFFIGFVLGMGVMHWYLHSSAPVMTQVSDWFNRSGSNYSGKKTHDAARDLLDSSSRR